MLQMCKKTATTTTQKVAMVATPLALWNVDTIAVLTIRALVLLFRLHVSTKTEVWYRKILLLKLSFP